MHLDVRVDCGHLGRYFDAGWSSATDHDVTVFCLDRGECFAQRCCGQGTARRECVGVLRHSRHSLAVSHTPQSIDQVIILHMVRYSVFPTGSSVAAWNRRERPVKGASGIRSKSIRCNCANGNVASASLAASMLALSNINTTLPGSFARV